MIARRMKEEGTCALEPWVWTHGVRLQTAVKWAQTYRQDTIAFSGRETDGEFHILTIDEEAGAVTNVERFHKFDPIAVASWYSVRGLRFQYVPCGWMEGVWMGNRSNPSQPRAR